jgi:predicted lipid-binding transport protein (Tim44 family)
MSDGSNYADLIILALIAGFILLRLRSVLGDKVGNDNPSYFNKVVPSKAPQAEPIVQLDEKSTKLRVREEDPYMTTVSDKDLLATVDAIKDKDPQFTATAFLQGAKMAYEMVFDAFDKGDRKTLAMLLSDDLMKTFSKELDEREKSAHKSETTLVSVKAKDITEASLKGSVASFKVLFESEQISVVRDSDGKITEGDASKVDLIVEDWVFERNTTSKNPNWKIIET